MNNPLLQSVQLALHNGAQAEAINRSKCIHRPV